MCPQTPPTRFRRRRRLSLFTVVAAASLLGPGTIGVTGASASSHREAPGTSKLPAVDTTDVYAFHSPNKPGSVTLLANWHPFSEPTGGPNFYLFDDDARYDIAVDTDGDALANVVYRWTFTTKVRDGNTYEYNKGPVTSLYDQDLNIYQTYTLQVFKAGAWHTLRKNMIAAPSFVGDASMPNYTKLRRQATYTAGNLTTFAGQADDPFFLDLRVFNLAYGGNLSEVGNDTLRGYNVNTTAVEVPVSELGGAKNIAGVWSRTYKKDSNGTFRQVSRLGMPLFAEVVVQLKDKDKYNASRPFADAQFRDQLTDPVLPRVLNRIYNLPIPATPRNDLVQVFFTGVPGLNQPKNVRESEMIRLNLTPFANQNYSRLGVIDGDNNGYPNGRRLADDTLDISLQVVEGELVGNPNDLGDGVNVNDVPFETVFPYIGLPNTGSRSVNMNTAGTPVSPLEGGQADSSGTAPAAPSARTAVAGATALGTAGIGTVALLLWPRRGRHASGRPGTTSVSGPADPRT